MDFYGVCKVVSIGASMLGGAAGAVAAVPELKNAINSMNTTKQPVTTEENVNENKAE